MNYIKKTLLLPTQLNILFSIIDSKSILIFKNKTSEDSKYVFLPSEVQFEKVNDLLIFKVKDIYTLKKNKDLSFLFLNNFILTASRCIKSLEKTIKKKLILKGLGFRASVSSDSKILELKLGYSHTIKLNIPTEDLNVKVDKNTLIVEGFNSVKVGNFSNTIRNLKYPDSYKGKGFWYKNEIRTLKEVKKT